MRLESSISQIIVSSLEEAKKRHHLYVTPEHILYSILLYPSGNRLVNKLGCNPIDLQSKLNIFFENEIKQNNCNKNSPIESQDYKIVLNKTAYYAKRHRNGRVIVEDILLAICDNKNLLATQLLNGDKNKSIINGICINKNYSVLDENNVSHSYIKKIINKQDFTNNVHIEEDFNIKDNTSRLFVSDPFIDKFTQNITKLALENEIDPVVSRDKEIERTITILNKRNKRNPLYIGYPGTGKTSIAEDLAVRIIKNMVPDNLKNNIVLKLDISCIIAGTKYRGEFEERLRNIMNKISEYSNIIIYIDEIHNIIGAGATNGTAMDASNIIKPFLTNKKIKCIGSTTYYEFRKFFEKDKALVRRFEKVIISEPSEKECIKILNIIKYKYENHHNVIYSNNFIKGSIKYSVKYLQNLYLPDKAINIMDEAGSLVANRLKNHKGKYKSNLVTTRDLVSVISDTTGIPIKNIVFKDHNIQTIKNKIISNIYGQDEAIESIVECIQTSKLGLYKHTNKPLASIMLTGPTGVGKTESAYLVAKYLNMKYIRIDMSEFKESHSISKLIGSPQGYIGYEEGSMLVNSLENNPSLVIILDEIEKAHSNVHNLLLQILDYGTITSQNNKKANFTEAIIIMTSNIGYSNIYQSIGFNNNISIDKKELNNKFSKEFLNRIDKIVNFNFIDNNAARQIINNEINYIKTESLRRFNTKININKQVISYINNKIYEEISKNKISVREIKSIISKILTYKISQMYLKANFKPDYKEINITLYKNIIKLNKK